MEDKWLKILNKCKYLPEEDLFLLCKRVKDILLEENNVQHVSTPVIIYGDIHSHLHDLRELFSKGDLILEKNYIFMGNCLDSGYQSVETYELLLALKVKYRGNITLLRGNRVSSQISHAYCFYNECISKYGNSNPWKYCTEVFDYFNLAAVVENKILCINEGLSPELKSLVQIRNINRKIEILYEGAFCETALEVKKISKDIDEIIEKPFAENFIIIKSFQNLNGKNEEQFNREAKIKKNKEYQLRLKEHEDKKIKMQKTKEIMERKKIAEENLKIQKNQGSDSWKFVGKKHFLYSLQISDFINDFGQAGTYYDNINEIFFSIDGKYAFICIFYIGKFK